MSFKRLFTLSAALAVGLLLFAGAPSFAEPAEAPEDPPEAPAVSDAVSVEESGDGEHDAGVPDAEPAEEIPDAGVPDAEPAAEPDYHLYLNPEKTVVLDYKPMTGRQIIISGNGKIDRDMYFASVRQTYFTQEYDTWSPEMTKGIPLLVKAGVQFPDNSREMFGSYGGPIHFEKGVDTSNVILMGAMFRFCADTITGLEYWDTGNVQSMMMMFFACPEADPKVDSWDTKSLHTANNMFMRTKKARPAVSGWNTSNLYFMNKMFAESNCSPDISRWDVSKVQEMDGLFKDAMHVRFRGNDWKDKVRNVMTAENMFNGAAMSMPDIRGWYLLNLHNGKRMFANLPAGRLRTTGLVLNGECDVTEMFLNTEVYCYDLRGFTTKQTEQVMNDLIYKENGVWSAGPRLWLNSYTLDIPIPLNPRYIALCGTGEKENAVVTEITIPIEWKRDVRPDPSLWIHILGNDEMEGVDSLIANGLSAVGDTFTPPNANVLFHVGFDVAYWTEDGWSQSVTKVGDDWYFFDPKTHLSYHGGWKTVGGNTYYFGFGGKAERGLQPQDGGIIYYFDDSTAIQLKDGWKTVNGKTYYFNHYGVAVRGLRWIDGELYLFGPDCAQIKAAWHTENGRTYYFNQYGPACRGLREIGQELYFFDETSRAQLKSRWKTVNGKTYYFNQYGPAYRGLRKIDGQKYYFDMTTRVQLKGGWKTIAGKTYYFSVYGPAVKGLRTIGGVTYGFSPECVQYKDCWATIGGKRYHFNKWGVMDKIE